MTDVSFSQSGKWVMSASKDCTIRLWNVAESDKIPVPAADNKKSVGFRVSTVSEHNFILTVGFLNRFPVTKKLQRSNLINHFGC